MATKKTLPETSNKKKRGRPKKYENVTERVKSFRERRLGDSRRLDVYISSKASWRLTKLARAWECSRGKALDRLLMEADGKYQDILFPETE